MPTRPQGDVLKLFHEVSEKLTMIEDRATRTDARADESNKLAAQMLAQVEALHRRIESLAETQETDRIESVGQRRELKQLINSSTTNLEHRLNNVEIRVERKVSSKAEEVAEEAANRVAGKVSRSNRPLQLGIWATVASVVGTAAVYVVNNIDKLAHAFQVVVGIQQKVKP